MTRFDRLIALGVVWVPLCFMVALVAAADKPGKKGGWVAQRDAQTGNMVRVMEMMLHPQQEPRPALKYRFVPDDFDLVDGNAAIFYLKAMGFLEQDAARKHLMQFDEDAWNRMLAQRKAGNFSGQVPPYVWQGMTPQELPLDEVKQYLSLTSFQPQFLKDAATRRTMDLDRRMRDVDDPIGYLLPDIQEMRTLAYLQDLRCRVAVAEGRIQDALDILSQQYVMAWHLGGDEVVVANLVGVVCAEMTFEDVLYLVQRPETPNLYWALATLPRPLIDLRRARAFERQLLYEQFKMLREVDETPRPVGYWQEFVDRLAGQVGTVAREFRLPAAVSRDPATARTAIVGFVASAYPGARRFLVEQCGLSPEQVASYPTAQAVFLAVVRYYDQARDDVFKWTYIPFSQTPTGTGGGAYPDTLQVKPDEVGWCAMPADELLAVAGDSSGSAVRAQQTIALLQTVEAIRMYGAAHQAKLPPALDDVPVAAPVDPATDEPFDYEYAGDHAVLTSQRVWGIQYRLVLRFAKQEEGTE